ncbi:MAG: amidohydrolase [Bacteroidetes bacterium QS_9_68_14]|nr:MAG: amidohydrolase [Bacteroidetes bacterium QS_9_68_14]
MKSPLLTLAALLALATALPNSAQAQQRSGGTVTIVHGAEAIYTADPDRPTAEAFAMQGGRLLMVGSERPVREAYPDARSLDAEGRTIVPGFIDAHAHLSGLATSLLQADLVGTSSPDEIVQRLEDFAEERGLPEGAWLTGRGWDQNDWPGDASFPTREVLDEAFPERPVWLTRIDGHAGWANTAALEAAGRENIQGADDPEGGKIIRNENGEPTGVFVDAAMGMVSEAQPELTRAERVEGLRRALEQTRSKGLTGVHDAGIGMETINIYKEAIDEGNFPLRVYAMVDGRGDAFDHFCESGMMTGQRGLGYGGRLAVRSVKFYMDGALGSRGAALLADYSDDPGNRGLLRREPSAFLNDVNAALDCGFQVNTHAIGDRANRVVLDAYEQARATAGDTDPGRHRIEHAQILAPADLERFATLGIIASMQPTHATSDMPWAGERLGEERLETSYAWRSLAESGAHLAFGSDFPVEDVDPLEGFYAAVTRQDAEGNPESGWLPSERVSRRAALRSFTRGAAYAAFQEDHIGSLRAGKRADFVMLSRDIMQVPTDEILGAEVAATYLDGEKVYEMGSK